MATARQVSLVANSIFGTDGKILASGKVYFYKVGTTTLKDVWVDGNKTTVSANPVILDARGTAEVYGDGEYRVVIKDSSDVPVDEFANFQFEPVNTTEATLGIDASTYGSDGAAIASAISAASSANKTVFLKTQTWNVTADLTIPTNINLQFIGGAYLNISSGITVTVSGEIQAPYFNIFQGAGNVSISKINHHIPSVWVSSVTGTVSYTSGTNTHTLYNDVSVADNLAVTGNATVGGTLGVTGVSTLSEANITTLKIGGSAVTSTAAELNILDGVTSTAAELNILDGVTSTAAELNILDGVTSTAAELNILDGVTSTAAELNILDGVTSTASELNLNDGSVAETIVNNKSVVYGSDGQVNAKSIKIQGTEIVDSDKKANFSESVIENATPKTTLKDTGSGTDQEQSHEFETADGVYASVSGKTTGAGTGRAHIKTKETGDSNLVDRIIASQAGLDVAGSLISLGQGDAGKIGAWEFSATSGTWYQITNDASKRFGGLLCVTAWDGSYSASSIWSVFVNNYAPSSTITKQFSFGSDHISVTFSNPGSGYGLYIKQTSGSTKTLQATLIVGGKCFGTISQY